MNAEGKTEDQQFDDAEERLFRRFSPEDFQDGKVGLQRIKASVHFPKAAETKADPTAAKKSPSWVRSRYAQPEDAVHPSCANDREDVAHYGVISMKVGELNKGVAAVSSGVFDFYPVHDPLPLCYAHTLIYSCLTGEAPPKYDAAPKDVVNALRQRIYARQVIEIAPSDPQAAPR